MTKERLKAGCMPSHPAKSGNMTNFDHSIADGLEEELKADSHAVAEYAAWNFHAEVVYLDGEFHAVVMRYHALASIESAPTLAELMKVCSDKYGQD